MSCIWTVCSIWGFFVEERGWKLEKVQDSYRTGTCKDLRRHAEGTVFSLENRELGSNIILVFDYLRWSFWAIKAKFFSFEVHRILLVAFFEDEWHLLTVLRNLPQWLSPFKDKWVSLQHSFQPFPHILSLDIREKRSAPPSPLLLLGKL